MKRLAMRILVVPVLLFVAPGMAQVYSDLLAVHPAVLQDNFIQGKISPLQLAEERFTSVYPNSFTLSASSTQPQENGTVTITATLAQPAATDMLIDVSLSGTARFDSDYSSDFSTKGPSTVAGGNGSGSAANQFNYPYGVFVDSSGNLFVSDHYNSRVQKWVPGATSGVTVAGGNGYGSAANQLSQPSAIFVDASGNLFVCDVSNQRVQKWVLGATSGVTVAGGNGSGSDANQFSNPYGIFVDAIGNLFVSDYYNSRVQKWAPGATSGVTVAGGNGYGSAANQLSYPVGIFVDASGNLFVSDYENNRIQKWAPGATSGVTVAGGNGNGSGTNQLARPTGIFVDAYGNLFVSDYYNYRIQKWEPGAISGSTVAGGNGYGSNKFQLSYPEGVFLDAKGNIYITDVYNHRIQRYQVNPQIYIPAGSTSGSITLNAVDDDSYEGNESVIVEANALGQPSQTSTNQLAITLLDNDQTPVVSFEISKTKLWEKSNDSAVVTARLSAVSVLPSTIQFAESGNAVKDVEYQLSGTQIMIPPGSLTGTVTIRINGLDDNEVELMDSVTLNIQTLTNCSSSTQRVSVYIESEDDPTVTLQGNPLAFSEADSTVITATLSAPTSRQVIIDLKTSGAAILSKDYSFGNFPTKGKFSTVLGGYGSGPSNLILPTDVFVDASEAVFVADAGNHRVQKLTKGSTEAVTVAGGYGAGVGSLQLNYPEGIFVDSKGNLYIADANNHRIQRWAPGAEVGVTVAGGNGAGANANQLNYPRAVFVDTAGNIYIADAENHRIQKWGPRATSGTTIAGGNGAGAATNQLNQPWDLFFTSDGTLYIADYGNRRIQKWLANSSSGSTIVSNPWIGIISVFVDAAANIYYNNYGSYYDATINKFDQTTTVTTLLAGMQDPLGSLNYPRGIFVDSLGNLYIADQSNSRIQRYQFGPQITIPAGSINGSISIKGINDNQYEVDEQIKVFSVSAVNATAANTNPVPLTILDNDSPPVVTFSWDKQRVRENTADSAILTARLAGSSTMPITLNFGVTGSAVQNTDYLLSSTQITIPAGDTIGMLKVYINHLDDAAVEQLDSILLTITSVINATAPQNPPALFLESDDDPTFQLSTSGPQMAENGTITVTATLSQPTARDLLLDIDMSGIAIYTKDYSASFPTKRPTTVAGGNGQGSNANQLSYPFTSFVDKSGNLFVVDAWNHRVQKWTPGAKSGITVAGGNGPGSESSQLAYPQGVFVDESGNIFVADANNHRIQKWIPGSTSGITVAGGNGPGSNANQLHTPWAVFVDANSNIYVSDYTNQRVQKWIPGATSGVTVAGGNGQGSNPNQLYNPWGIFVDAYSNVFVSEQYNHRVQKWTPGATSGLTVAGGNGQGANMNQLSEPAGIYVDTSGNLYVADIYNHRIQQWDPGGTFGTVIAGGNGAGFNIFQLNGPTGVFLDGKKNLYIADLYNHRIQRYQVNPQILIPAGSTIGTVILDAIDDDSYEGNESVIVKAVIADKPAEKSTNTLQLTILDNDAPPTVSFEVSKDKLWEKSNDSAVVTARLSALSVLPSTIQFAVTGNAVRDVEYQLSGTQITIPPGSLTGTVAIRINGLDDNEVELLDSVVLQVQTLTNCSSSTQSVSVYIESEDDPTFTLQVNPLVFSEADSTVLTATLSAPSSREVLIDLNTSGVAELAKDYSFGNFATKGTFSSVLGGYGSGPSNLNQPTDVLVDGSGTVFIADAGNQRVQKLTKGSTQAVTVAGGYGAGSGNLQLNSPEGIFVDKKGNLYIADAGNHRIQRWAPGAEVGVTVAGGNGAGSNANQLSYPRSVFVDTAGNLYIADAGNHRIQKWAPRATSGTTVAGGNGAGAAMNQLNNPYDLFVVSDGTLYIADYENRRIQKWLPNANSGLTILTRYNWYEKISSVYMDAGQNIYYSIYYCCGISGVYKFDPKSSSSVLVAGNLGNVRGIFVDSLGNVYTTVQENHFIQRNQYGPQIIIPAGSTLGRISIKGIDDTEYEGDEVIRVSTASAMNATSAGPDPVTVTVKDNDAPPTISFEWDRQRILENTNDSAVLTARLSAPTLFTTTIQFSIGGNAVRNTEYVLRNAQITIPPGASTGTLSVLVNKLDDPAIELLDSIVLTVSAITNAMTSQNPGTLYLESDDDPTVTGITTSATQMNENGGAVTITATISAPSSRDAIVHLDMKGTALELGDYDVIYAGKAGPSTVAGGNGAGSASNQLFYPQGVCVDKAGNIFIADNFNRIQKWAPGANFGVTVLGGNGSGNYQSISPSGVFIDKYQNLYILDINDSKVLKMSPGASSGVTVAGGNGNGSNANQIGYATGLYVDSLGDIYIADAGNNRIQKWVPGASTGVTVAGGIGYGSNANQLSFPTGVYVDAAGNIYVADLGNARIQKWASGATSGVTVAGGNGWGSNASQLSAPWAVYVDTAGNIYVADAGNNRIQKWKSDAGIGITIAGGRGKGSDVNQFDFPIGISRDSAGNLFVADHQNHRIQKYPYYQPQIRIPAGQTSGTIVFNAINDSSYENNETILVEASSAMNTILSGNYQKTLTIIDDDAPPKVNFQLSTSSIIENSPDSLVITATPSIVSGKPITIRFTVSGTATRNSEYVLSDTVLVIPADLPSSSIYIRTRGIDDALVEPLESIILSITQITNASSDSSRITVYLVSDDDPTYTLTSSTTSIGENQSVLLTASLSAACARDAFINVSIGGGTACYGVDYSPGSLPSGAPSTVAGGYGYGSSSYQIGSPSGIHIDNAGIIYVADRANHRIQKWGPGASSGVTVAGGNGQGAEANQLNWPNGVYVDLLGNVYVADAQNHRIQKWSPGASSGVTVAGGNGQGSNSNQLSYPVGVFVDLMGNVFVADGENYRIQKWAPGASSGITVAGGNGYGSNANQLSSISGFFINNKGNIFISDAGNYRIQKWTLGATSGQTVAGGYGYGSNSNQLSWVSGVFADSLENVYIADASNHRIQKWVPGATTGITVAGGNGQGSNSNQLNYPQGVFVDQMENVYVSDYNNRIQKFRYGLHITVPAGQTSASLTLNAIDDNIYEGNETIQVTVPYAEYTRSSAKDTFRVTIIDNEAPPMVYLSTSAPTIVEGATQPVQLIASLMNPTTSNVIVDFAVSGTAALNTEYTLSSTRITIPAGQTSASLNISTNGLNDALVEPLKSIIFTVSNITNAVAAVTKDTLYLESDDDPNITWVLGATQIMETDSMTLTATLSAAASRDAIISFGLSGPALYGSDYSADFPLKKPSTLAGNKIAGNTNLQLNNPSSVFVDRNGNTYVADANNHRIQRWAPFASTGTTVAGGNGAGAGSNQLNYPTGIYVDSIGNMYIADANNHRVLKWTIGASNGIVVAGGNGAGIASNKLNYPAAVFVDQTQNMFIVDQFNHRVQRWAPGAVSGTTVAGGNGQGSAANQLFYPSGIYVNVAGQLFIADNGNHRIQRWIPGGTSGTTVAGGNGFGSASNQLNYPTGVFADTSGTLYIADTENHRIQKFLSGATTGITVAGTGISGSDSNRLYSPSSIYVDALGNLFIADTYNHRIQKYQNGPQVLVPAGQLTGSIKIKGIPDALSEVSEDAIFNVQSSANVILVNTSPQKLAIKDAVGYCTSSGISSREYINRYAITGIVDNTSGNNNGYGDYKNITLNIKRNTAYSLSIYPAWIGTARSEVYAVWIDYNNDADFLDAGEQIFTRAKTTVSPVTGTFTVPVTAVIGNVRMRVSMKYNAAPTSCEVGFAGEVEDYTVSITDPVALDVQPPTTPLNLAVSNVTTASVDLSWSPSTDNVRLSKYDIYRDGILWGSSTQTKATVSGLSSNTRYAFFVKAVDSAGNVSPNSNQVDTITPAGTYCQVNGSTTLREYINRFQVGTINNTSGANAGGYGNYLSLSTNLTLGSTNAVTIIPGWNGTARSEAYRVWIDFNRDGDFADAGEQVFNQAKTTATTISGSIIIPSTVTTGSTRMRVIIKYNASPVPCEVAGFAGEAEDYTVNIIAPLITRKATINREEAQEIAGPGFSIYPNPVHQSEVHLKLNGLVGEKVLVFDINGKLVMADRFVKRLNVSSLANGTYFVVIMEKGQLWRRKLVKQ